VCVGIIHYRRVFFIYIYIYKDNKKNLGIYIYIITYLSFGRQQNPRVEIRGWGLSMVDERYIVLCVRLCDVM